ncbi:GDYXXLXY domain-containing protein [Adhaeribacter radiodurans]|uniref:GDYXXLXY domain-containing protein n=1 Tax=Adhaeribacter radiodurans TaxID=2745197 RepID=A0A7L7LFU9_9BACT|nr:GDYXXLXY domain-containing protein [Adhaeribacter radiodurans]QMU31395.1 GDYXXLXY domain-containing protein [Adhaeribacter radiodurans]
MSSKKFIIATFILVALVQLYVPAKMILDQKKILKIGTEFKFKTAPVDPHDPFRGKYITLNYAENEIKVPEKENWITGEPVYVSLAIGKDGFAKIKSVAKEKPGNNVPFVKAKVRYVTDNGSNQLTIDYPFDRFYLEESKAYDAELIYQQLQQDTTQITYALVSINNGNAVIKDVLIRDKSIREVVKANQEKKK